MNLERITFLSAQLRPDDTEPWWLCDAMIESGIAVPEITILYVFCVLPSRTHTHFRVDQVFSGWRIIPRDFLGADEIFAHRPSNSDVIQTR